MAKCKKCGNHCSSSDNFCYQCGLKAPKHIFEKCPSCKTIVLSYETFCTKCGKKVDRKKLIKEVVKK